MHVSVVKAASLCALVGKLPPAYSVFTEMWSCAEIATLEQVGRQLRSSERVGAGLYEIALKLAGGIFDRCRVKVGVGR